MRARPGWIALLATGASTVGFVGAGPQQVAKVDLLTALEPQGIIQVRELRTQGTLHLCAGDQANVEARVERGQPSAGSPCAQLRVERVDREGAFPYVDATIGTTAYPANEAHLLLRAGRSFLFLEGGHDQSVLNQHVGTVFLISPVSRTDQPALTLVCSGRIEAYDVEERYQCIGRELPPRDVELVVWTDRETCSIDYSMCD